MRQDRLAELQGERERLERAGARLVTAYQEELIGLDELRSRMPAMRSRKRVLEAELEAIETVAEERERYLRIAETLESFRERLRAGSESLDVIERQKVLRSLVKEVLVDDGEITIRHSIPVTESASPSCGKPAADLPQRNPTPQSYLLRWGSHQPPAREFVPAPRAGPVVRAGGEAAPAGEMPASAVRRRRCDAL